MDNNKDISIDSDSKVTDPQDNGEKLFTQEDINRILKERLTKEREKLSKPSEREEEVSRREARLTCREYLLDVGAPSELLEVLDTSNADTFKTNVEALQKMGLKVSAATAKTGLSHQGGREVGGNDEDIASAFGLSRR